MSTGHKYGMRLYSGSLSRVERAGGKKAIRTCTKSVCAAACFRIPDRRLEKVANRRNTEKRLNSGSLYDIS
jgi:hypothetical protein